MKWHCYQIFINRRLFLNKKLEDKGLLVDIPVILKRVKNLAIICVQFPTQKLKLIFSFYHTTQNSWEYHNAGEQQDFPALQASQVIKILYNTDEERCRDSIWS